eukprot:2772624-Rhodomonas_salina.1
MTFGFKPLCVAPARCSKEAVAQPSQMPNSRSSFLDARIRSVRARFNSASGLRERGGAVTRENTVSRSRAQQVQRGIPGWTYPSSENLLQSRHKYPPSSRSDRLYLCAQCFCFSSSNLPTCVSTDRTATSAAASALR